MRDLDVRGSLSAILCLIIFPDALTPVGRCHGTLGGCRRDDDIVVDQLWCVQTFFSLYVCMCITIPANAISFH